MRPGGSGKGVKRLFELEGASVQTPLSSARPNACQKLAAPWLSLGILTFIYTIGFVDRQVLSLVIQPMKSSLGLSDTRLSLLQGAAFTIAYVLLGPVFGRIIDNGNRRNTLFGGVIGWSVFSVLFGYSRNFWALFGARMGVGGAEACLSPAAWSILTDTFDRQRLARAFSIFLMAPYLGGGLALIFGGAALRAVDNMHLDKWSALAGLEPWQITFILLGAPGVLAAGLLFLVPEPPRSARAQDPRVLQSDAPMRLRDVAAIFWQRRAFYGRFFLGMAALDTLLYIIPAWLPAHLIRNFRAVPATVGFDYGAAILVSGSLGVLLGPSAARRLAKYRPGDEQLFLAVIVSVLLVPLSILIPLAGSYLLTLIAGAAAGFLYSLPQSLAASAVTGVTPGRMRGVCTAVYIFIVTVLALGCGPTLVALLTDHMFGDPAKVGVSLAIVAAGCSGLAALCLIGALPHYRALLAQRIGHEDGQ